MKIIKIGLPLLLFFLVVAAGYFVFTHLYGDSDKGAMTGNVLNVSDHFQSVMADNLPNYFGIGYFKDQEGLIPLNYTETIPDDNFTGYFTIFNGLDQENEYYLMALMDYQAVPIYYDGTVDTLHAVNLSPRHLNNGKFTLENVSTGYHDITFLVFGDPDNRSLDNITRMGTMTHTGSVRFNAISGNTAKPKIEFQDILMLNNTTFPFNGIMLAKEPFSQEAWLSENVTKNQTLRYYVNIGNQEDNLSFVLMQFLDYKQIPVKNGQAGYTYYGRLNKSGECSIPVSLTVPDTPGVHQLMVIMATNPYNDIGASLGGNISIANESSVRVGLNVTA